MQTTWTTAHGISANTLLLVTVRLSDRLPILPKIASAAWSGRAVSDDLLRRSALSGSQEAGGRQIALRGLAFDQRLQKLHNAVGRQ